MLVMLFVYEDNLLRVADPLFVEACQQNTVSRYYSCENNIANNTEILNDRVWLTCPTYIGIYIYIFQITLHSPKY